jgi:release factor glutamine methyltransferase
MTFREALARGNARLGAAGAESPYLDAVVLLAHCSGTDKASLFARFQDDLPAGASAAFEEALGKRLDGLPVSYILHRKEFFGLSFYVDERVLVPRPDTETLVETLLSLMGNDPSLIRVHDVCTGTGCIPIAAVSALQESRETDFSASDVSEAALEVFRINSLNLLGRVLPNRRSDLLGSVEGCFDVVTANPPYLTCGEAEELRKKRWPEPILALHGGEDGLDLVRRLAGQAVERLRENGYLIIEGSDPQAERIIDILDSRGFRDLRTVRDLAGKRRITLGRRGP